LLGKKIRITEPPPVPSCLNGKKFEIREPPVMDISETSKNQPLRFYYTKTSFVFFPHPPWASGYMPMLKTGGYLWLIQSLKMIKGAFTLGVRDSSSVESVP